MSWNDMDWEDKGEAIWRLTHEGMTVKEIAAELDTNSHQICEFANAFGVAIRKRLPSIARGSSTQNTTSGRAHRKRHAALADRDTKVNPIVMHT